MSDINVYAWGLCYLSACTPMEMPRDEVERAANLSHPTGVTPWKISDENFRGGGHNPSPCEDDECRHHFLLVC